MTTLTEEEFKGLSLQEKSKYLCALTMADDRRAYNNLWPLFRAHNDREKRKRKEEWINRSFTTPEAKAIYYGAEHVATVLGEKFDEILLHLDRQEELNGRRLHLSSHSR